MDSSHFTRVPLVNLFNLIYLNVSINQRATYAQTFQKQLSVCNTVGCNVGDRESEICDILNIALSVPNKIN